MTAAGPHMWLENQGKLKGHSGATVWRGRGSYKASRTDHREWTQQGTHDNHGRQRRLEPTTEKILTLSCKIKSNTLPLGL